MVAATVLDGLRVDVDPCRGGGSTREQRGAVALAAPEVEHASPLNQRAGPEVAVEVLVDRLRLISPRNEALASPLDQPRLIGHAPSLTRTPRRRPSACHNGASDAPETLDPAPRLP